MDRELDLFEHLPDGSVLWRAVVRGLENAQLKLQELSKGTSNECFALHTPTKEIVARVNPPQAKGQAVKRVVFQIAYDEELLVKRAELLRHRGYDVVSAVGNEAAKIILNTIRHCDMFIVGHAAPEEIREEMVKWLKPRFPGVKVLALNPPLSQDLPGADYNVVLNGPEKWLAIVDQTAS